MFQEQTSICPVVELINHRPATTSLKIAECFEKRHDHVLRDIQSLIEQCPQNFTDPNFGVSEYTDSTGRKLPMYTIYFDGFILLVMGYTGKKALNMKLAYIAAFNAMREQLEAQSLQKMQQLPASDVPITPDQQCTLQAMVRALVERGGIYANIWSRFNNHFRLGSYKQLPQSRMSEAVDYLMRFEVAPKALPGPEFSVQAFHNTLPADMDTGRKDALCKIRSIMNAMLAARDVVSMFCYPEPATMDKPKAFRLTYAARHDFYAAALDCLAAAHADLEAGYKLNHLHGRG